MRRTEEKIARRIDFSEAMRLGREKVWTLDPGGLDPIQYFTDEPAALPPPAPSGVGEPIKMILHCPSCGLQHIDQPNDGDPWTNPPHRSHLCHGCGSIWRPADVPTEGVAAIKTKGSADHIAPAPLPSGVEEADAKPMKRTMTLTLTDEEMAKLEELAAKKDLSPPAVFRLALRHLDMAESEREHGPIGRGPLGLHLPSGVVELKEAAEEVLHRIDEHGFHDMLGTSRLRAAIAAAGVRS